VQAEHTFAKEITLNDFPKDKLYLVVNALYRACDVLKDERGQLSARQKEIETELSDTLDWRHYFENMDHV
jgi:hypothetical protein